MPLRVRWLLPALLLPLTATAGEPTHLRLDEALARLEAQSPALAAAAARADEAQALHTQALAGVLPTLSATAGYTRNNAEVELDLSALADLMELAGQLSGQEIDASAMPGKVTLQPLQSVNGAVALRVPLLNVAGWAQLGATQNAADAADEARSAARLGAQAQLLTAALAAGAAESWVGVAEASAERSRRFAATTHKLVDAGVGPPLAALQADAEVVRHDQDLLSARAAREKARLAVGVLLGEAGPVVVDLGTVEVDGGAGERPELRAAAEQVRAAELGLAAARWAALPYVSGSLFASASDVEFPTGEKTAWKATVDLTWPLVAGGQRLGRIDQAEAQLAQARANEAATRLSLTQEAVNARADLDVAKARLELARAQVTLAERAAALAEQGYGAGTVSVTDLLDASDRLDRARFGLVDAEVRVTMATVALRRAQGQGW